MKYFQVIIWEGMKNLRKEGKIWERNNIKYSESCFYLSSCGCKEKDIKTMGSRHSAVLFFWFNMTPGPWQGFVWLQRGICVRFCVGKNMTRRNQNLFFVEENFKTCKKTNRKKKKKKHSRIHRGPVGRTWFFHPLDPSSIIGVRKLRSCKPHWMAKK